MRSPCPLLPRAAALFAFVLAPFATACDTPHTAVVLDNQYSPSDASPLVVYDAFWLTVDFQPPVPPGASSAPESTPAASPDTAYVLLAPGWDPSSTTPPSAYVLLESRQGFAVRSDDTLHIPVDDTTFVGSCAAGSPLPQDRADFMTRFVFARELGSLAYDAATCTTTGGR
jgi:hypothetical protein